MLAENIDTSDHETQDSVRHFRSDTGDLSVRIDTLALIRFELQIRESVEAIRGHGVEIGGLILGHRVERSSRNLVITSFAPVEIEHRFGPLFRLSEVDTDLLNKKAQEGGDTVVGYFRSQLRGGPLVRDEDLQILSQLFPEKNACFATVEATVNTPSVIHLHKVAAGGSPTMAIRFPVKESKVVPEISEPVSSPVLPSAYEEPQEPALELKRRPTAALWISGAIAAAVALAFGSYLIGRYSASVPQPVAKQTRQTAPRLAESSAIELHLEGRDSQVEIRWNPSSPLVRTSVRGLLIVSDGPALNRIDLDTNQVRSGAYGIKPHGDKLTVWMTAYQSNGSFAGETKELSRVSAKAVTPKPQASTQNEPQPAQITSSESVETRSLPPLEPNNTASSWSNNPPSLPPEPVHTAVKLEPPPMERIVAPAPQIPSLPVPAPPSPAIKYQSSVNRSAAARVIYQAVPSVPLTVSSRIRSEVQLDVAVLIDTNGKVTGAHVVSSRGALAGLLAIEALKAAQLCRFSPAQEDGHPVPSNMTLTFRFAPKSN